MIRHIQSVSLGLAIALLTACSQPPDCRIDPAHADSATANAGCLIKHGPYMLAVEHPNGRLGFPGGRSEDGESAQCTAHRETWEEAGIDVEVGRLLREFDNGFRLYACHPVNSNITPAQPLSRPWTAWREIRSLQWLQPDSVSAKDWRFPGQWPQVQVLFENLP